MIISVTLRRIIIKDVESGEEYEVSTMRTAEEISAWVDELGQEQAIEQISDAVRDAYQPRTKKNSNY